MYNLGQSICRLFNFLALFVFITSETELDYYQQKVNVRVVLRVAEQLKNYSLRKLGSFKKISEMFGFTHSLFKLIFKATQLQKIPESDIFQKTLFCTLASSMNLGLNGVPAAAGQYL